MCMTESKCVVNLFLKYIFCEGQCKKHFSFSTLPNIIALDTKKTYEK